MNTKSAPATTKTPPTAIGAATELPVLAKSTQLMPSRRRGRGRNRR
jgi:hypothetical protein